MVRSTFSALGALAAAAVIGLATMAPAQDGATLPPQVHARQSLMGLYQYYLMPLGGMAQGKVPYDAEVAQSAAANLATLAKMPIFDMWPAGTSTSDIEGTRALPAMWDNLDDVVAKIGALGAAADAMTVAAGTGADALKAAMGPLGAACAGCHQPYRAP